MSIPKKHHYLPEFYLKGFTNDTNKLFIYDKKRKVIKKGDYAPSTHFFEMNRNSIEIDGKLDTFPEETYSKVDDMDKEILQFIQNQEATFTLDSYQIFQLQLFISNFIWRNPKFDEEYQQTMIENEPKENFFRIRNIEDGTDAPKELINKIKNSPAFIKSFRSSFGILKWMTNKNKYDHENWRISYTPKHYILVSDNPLIKTEEKIDYFESNFVFPLSKKFTLVRLLSEIKTKEFPPEFTLLVGVLSVLQANHYVGCSNKEHLERIVGLSNRFDIIQAKNQLFDILKACTKS